MTAFLSKCLIVVLLATTMAACSLVPKTAPATTLLLPVHPERSAWPAQLVPGRVQAAAALRTDQVLVVSGARLMQAPGLRWAATPAELVGETLSRWRASAEVSERSAGTIGQLDVMMDAFQWQEADATVLVAMHGQIRCPDDQRIDLREAVSAVPLATLQDPDALALAFSEATNTVVMALLEQADKQGCISERPVTSGGG